jgi:hypothetical protein
LIKYNLVTIGLIVIFSLPIIKGIFSEFTRERVRYSLESLLNNIEFIAGLFISIYLVRKILFEHDLWVYSQIYKWIPQNFKAIIHGQDILAYLFAVPVVLLVVAIVLRVLTAPLFNLFIVPFSNAFYSIVNSSNSLVKKIAGAVWQVPKAIYITLISALLLNFYTYYFYNPNLSKWMNESGVYQTIYEKTIYPVLNSNIAKKIPVLVNDSFRRVANNTNPDGTGSSGSSIADGIARQLKGKNVRIIEYFNGVTLDEAIKSTPEIDKTAKELVKNETDSRKKAYAIYTWVSRNIKYDYDKAKKVSIDPRGVPSGAQEAFSSRKGICFDYASLYVAMCRAVGLKVRLVTGLGYSGVSWGDHAWNQVYSPLESRWINVDATFGTIANYFDKPDFDVDHKYSDVQGEW